MRTIITSLVLFALGAHASAAFAQAGDDPLLIQSRSIVDEFARRLQAALQGAIADGGPAAAIDVCSTVAVEIASELSRSHGARVSRTSLKIRNPVNLPEPWQQDVLSAFEDQAPRADTAPAEYFARNPGEPARYMRAIPTGGLCLVCHGTDIAPEVADTLEREYPFDAARGYQAGDLRGAFSVVWPPAPADAAARDPR